MARDCLYWHERPSKFEIKAILFGQLFASYHPRTLRNARRIQKTKMLSESRYRQFQPVTDKLTLRVYKGMFSRIEKRDK